MMTSAELIANKYEELKSLQLYKNKSYGDTALNPPNIFSKLEPIEAIKVRLDDKLSRIKNMGITDKTEDSVKDAIGYLILLDIELDKKR